MGGKAMERMRVMVDSMGAKETEEAAKKAPEGRRGREEVEQLKRYGDEVLIRENWNEEN
jgi:hypothetical protein